MRTYVPNLPVAPRAYSQEDEAQFRLELERVLRNMQQARPEDFVTISNDAPSGTPPQGPGSLWVGTLGSGESPYSLDELTDVTITSVVAGHMLRHNGSQWVNVVPDASHIQTGTFADARIAQSNVTQHQAALSIAASQVTAGTFPAGTFRFSGALEVLHDVSDVMIRMGDLAGGTVNARRWDLRVDASGDFDIRSITDAGATTAHVLNITHAGVVTFPAGLSASVLSSGTLADARVAQSNVTQHQAALAIAASQVTSGTFADARIAQSNVTQHEAALTILESQISDGSILARIAAAETIAGAWSFNNTRIGQSAHSPVTFTAASHFAQPSGYRTIVSNASTQFPTGWSTYYFWLVVGRRDFGGGYNGLAFSYSDGRVWYGQNTVSSGLPNWYEIFTIATPQYLPTTDGTISVPIYSFASNPDVGMYYTAGSMNFTVNSVLHLTMGTDAGGSSWVYVPGVLRVGNELRLPNGTAGDPSLAFTSQETTGLYWSSSTINFTIAGTKRMDLDPNNLRIWANFRFMDTATGDDFFDWGGSGISVFRKLTNQGGLGIGADSSIVIHAGDMLGATVTGIGLVAGSSTENLYLAADSKIVILPNQQSGYTTAGRWMFSSTGLHADIAGSAGSPAFSLGGDTDTGFYSLGGNNFGFTLGGVLRLNFVNVDADEAYAVFDNTQVGVDWVNRGTGTGAITIDFDQGNVQHLNNTGSRTVTLAAGRNGFTYLLTIERGTGAASSWTWSTTIEWVGGTAPKLSTAAGARDVIFLAYVDGVWHGSYTLGHT